MITIIILTILVIILVKIVIVIIIMILIIIKKVVIRAIKMIIVIKIITLIMKITIVLKLIKIVVQSHNHKTYICSNSGNAQQEVKKTSYRTTLPHQVQCNNGTKNRDLQTLYSILRPKGAIVFRNKHSFQGTFPVTFSFKRVKWISFVNKFY